MDRKFYDSGFEDGNTTFMTSVNGDSPESDQASWDGDSERSASTSKTSLQQRLAKRRALIPARRRKVQVRSPSAASVTSAPSQQAKENDNSSTLARRARNNFSLLDHLGAGRIDPFNIYYDTPNANQTPMYVHEMVDHTLHASSVAYIGSDKQSDFTMMRTTLMDNLMANPLVWYSALMSSMTHHAFMRGEKVMPRDREMLRLSYRTKALGLLQEDIQNNGGMPSEQGMLAISTLIVHGGDWQDAEKFTYDEYNARKPFGNANDMNYYSSIYLDTSHWPSLVRFVRQSGGAANVKLAPMAGVFAIADSCIAWRTLTKPILETCVPTSVWLSMAAHRPDAAASDLEKRLLSSLPTVENVSPYIELYASLSHARTLVVSYNQYQRRYSQPQHNLRPDLKHVHFARILLMHDLLMLPPMSHRTHLLYEALRYTVLAFMQLVLFPIACVNNMPHRLLSLLVPLLRQATTKTSPDSRLDTSVFLWSWMLAGMLALEHLKTKAESKWMDELAPYVEQVSIKTEKSSWEMVKGVMETFLWVESECDGSGRQWWNYACLWLAAR